MFSLDFGAIEERTEDFLEHFEPENKLKDNFYNNLSQKDPEEGLFYLLLKTHFDCSKSARDFFEVLKWNDLKKGNMIDLDLICAKFFKKPRKIGDHRKWLRPGEKRIPSTIEMLESYREVVLESGSQSQFFEIDRKPDFRKIYYKMKNIKTFKKRLPRWDHIERLSRTHNFYVIPERFYTEEHLYGGPWDGLTLLFFDEEYREMSRSRKDAFRKYLKEDFPKQWNAQVEDEYKIMPRELKNWKDVIRFLEKWAIDRIEELLPADKHTPAYVFDLETCLCNWQKGRKRACS